MSEPQGSKALDVEFELTRLVRAVRERAMARLGSIHPDLDYNAFLLLSAIHDARGIRATEIADQLHIHKSTVSRGVTALEKLGLVERGPDPEDGRAQVLTLTADATDRLEAYRTEGRSRLHQIVSDWSEEDLEVFAHQLARLNAGAAELGD